ncbi:MAG: glycerate kinase [Planctomycetota bacterium]
MKIVVAMDSFKGSLTAEQACRIIKDALLSARPDLRIITKPMADGGEGTARAMIASANGKWLDAVVTGPLPGMKVNAGFAFFEDTKTTLVEMAAASGIELLSSDQLNPYKTTTLGTGQLIKESLKLKPEKIYLAVGGSATVDGGTGAATALGWQFLDKSGNQIKPGGQHLDRIAHIIPPENLPLPPVQVLCDVNNPLCGPDGAAEIFGPQKGATPAMVKHLDKGLKNFAAIVREQLGREIENVPGAGAAGGLAAGAIAFMNATLIPGIQAVIQTSNLAEAITDADWIITGEGRLDHQSMQGKVVCGIINTAKNTNAKVAAIAGTLALSPDECTQFGLHHAMGLRTPDMPLDHALKNAPQLLARTAKMLARKIFAL